MKKTLLILLCLSLFFSCKFKQIEFYEEEAVTKADTLDIKQIKIPTH